MSKVAVGCDRIDLLRDRLDGRATAGETHVLTRYRPTRHEELVGGSLYWIIKHQLVARSSILGFEEVEGRCLIRLEAPLVPVLPKLRRAHQGWRYLTEDDAPADLDGNGDGSETLPPALAAKLQMLALV